MKIKETFFLVGMKAKWDKNCSRILPGDSTKSAVQLCCGPSRSRMLEFALKLDSLQNTVGHMNTNLLQTILNISLRLYTVCSHTFKYKSHFHNVHVTAQPRSSSHLYSCDEHLRLLKKEITGAVKFIQSESCTTKKIPIQFLSRLWKKQAATPLLNAPSQHSGQ
jgi:hypothetical protein